MYLINLFTLLNVYITLTIILAYNSHYLLLLLLPPSVSSRIISPRDPYIITTSLTNPLLV